MAGSNRERALALMEAFAERTGVGSPDSARRYLWTDAFAVCNFLGLARATGDPRSRERALLLIDGVHRVLGRHRDDDVRRGWLSGLPDSEAEAHPTCAGLRIGKTLPERRPDEPFDERLEWERDGQYFHYLTRWMHALDQTARATGEPRFHRWACELARAAHRAFTYLPRRGAGRRMYWKMSIDLSRPLVASMGQHDPLDGLVTCAQLEATPPPPDLARDLAAARADFAAMVRLPGLATTDPLGLGGLLVEAYRTHQLERLGALPREGGLCAGLLAAALLGLRACAEQGNLRAPAERRLAFRELGLAIGLVCVERLGEESALSPGVQSAVEQLAGFLPLRSEIESFWLESGRCETDLWRAHADINDVMLATYLVPDGYLTLQPAPPRL